MQSLLLIIIQSPS